MKLQEVVMLAAGLFTPQITVIYIGVPFNVVVACAAGAFCSFAYGPKVEPRSRMFGLFFTALIMGCALTAVAVAALSHFLNVTLSSGVPAAMGAIISCLTPFLLPPIIDAARTGRWIDWLPFVNRKKPDGE